MKKYEMKDFLFELLNEHDSQFSDISLDGTLDALIVNTIDGERFIINVDYMKKGEDVIRAWARKNPGSLHIEMSLLQMADLGIITEEELRKYQSEIVKNADIIKKLYRNANL